MRSYARPEQRCKRCSGHHGRQMRAVPMARSKRKRTKTDAARHVSWARSVRRFWEEIRGELDSADAGTVPTDDSLFVELANLAQVSSPEGTERLRKGVSCELSFQGPVTSPVADKKQAASSKKREKLAVAQLRKSMRLSRDLSATVATLNGEASCAVDMVYDLHRRETIGGRFTPIAPNPDPPSWPSGDFISQLTELCGTIVKSADVPAARPQGRGSGPTTRPRRILKDPFKLPTGVHVELAA